MNRLDQKIAIVLALVALALAALGARSCRGGEKWVEEWRVLEVTAYCPCTVCTPGKGRTATGRDAWLPGVAVDPTVVPLGSRLDVPGYGERRTWWALADDTGIGIRGERLDVRFTTHKEAQTWGRQRLRCRVWTRVGESSAWAACSRKYTVARLAGFHYVEWMQPRQTWKETQPDGKAWGEMVHVACCRITIEKMGVPIAATAIRAGVAEACYEPHARPRALAFGAPDWGFLLAATLPSPRKRFGLFSVVV